MYNDDWDLFRAEVYQWKKESEQFVMKTWLEKIGFMGTIGYFISCDTVIIYSNRCGILIGKAGENINILKEILNKEYHKREWKVKFVENRGEFITV